MKFFHSIFARILWNSRLFIIFAVVLSMVGSILLFLVASIDIVKAVGATYQYYVGELGGDIDIHNILLNAIIMAIDLYLIAVVLLIFAFGLYELFIAKIEIKDEHSSKVLEIHTLDQLKDKLAKVIVMALIVAFFSKVLNMGMKDSLDMLYFAISILGLSLGLYFLHKDSKH
ncbi:YqhA family protein [Helicobacter kayseriensis]|uniref:YqhA family protein n=1 Tax=Helicobacter kayseriensis TaxID=2905877 RepID=UPI001E44CF38|nr:YqhA family protein [Helicobacter kayseriensis]MCE3046477.1 YqhA family protein [Helicobacter kayseriensis]MCE3048220.1 YqhA family protein [Helicobacter kayseriensis]